MMDEFIKRFWVEAKLTKHATVVVEASSKEEAERIAMSWEETPEDKFDVDSTDWEIVDIWEECDLLDHD